MAIDHSPDEFARRLLRFSLRNSRKVSRWVVGRIDAHAAARALTHLPTPRNLHLGCGTVSFAGWVNIDSVRTPGADFIWDLRRGVPGEDSSARYIYCEHFLEHLTPTEGVNFLRDCRRVLMPGGVLRIAMPSLDFLLERAVSPNWKDQDWLTWPEFQHVRTRAEMINMAFREWGHQWLYDREELHRRLAEAGFTHVRDVSRGESGHAELRNRETRADSLLVCEVEP